ncbi:MAG: molybdopterin biosynthesis protein [Bacillota bacterium]|nr:molybdopterin biosynthesis protein [Bacillota bacterium]
MAYQYLENITLEQAVDDFCSAAAAAHGRLTGELIAVDERALGRVNCKILTAAANAPHYNACAMDGVALNAALTAGVTDTTPLTLHSGQYVWVDTGDALPEGCDAVVMVEDVVEGEAEGELTLYAAAAPWQHVRQIGEDVCVGEMILPANSVITPAAIGALLATGIQQIEVYKRPLVGVIPTGDEIVSPRPAPAAGEIINFNTPTFAAMIKQWGGEPRPYDIVRDDLTAIKQALLDACSECDVVLINAGSSAGREDYSAAAIAELGTVLHHGIAIRPGKPTILGLIGNTPVLGVPGYPVSGIIVLRELLRPLLAALCGMAPSTDEQADAVLSRAIVSGLKYREFVRIKLGRVGDRLIATPLDRGAGVITSFLKADALLDLPQNCEGYEAGQTVRVELLRPRGQIENTLTIIGSHDPLIDNIADIMHRRYPRSYIASAHVGSMGGISAIKRCEAHLAGIHLLDEQDGSYNFSYLRQHFPDGGVALIRGFKRIQGLMVAKGNPLGLGGIGDLQREGLRYVNRQRGAGTRILLDYLLKQRGMSSTAVYGYNREEPTHIAVATQIASGSADCGLGIYAAAQACGLDFLPICDEEYDFLIDARFLELDLVRQFLAVLTGEEFAAQAAAAGGYDLDGAGRIISEF